MIDFFTLPAPVILEVSGRDSSRYLNARLTNDVKNLPVGGELPAAALTAQGRTEALFRVLRTGPETVLLLCDGGERAAIRKAFAQFIVADRVEVRDVSDERSVLHLIGARAERVLDRLTLTAPDKGSFAVQGGALLISADRIGAPGIDLVLPSPEEAPVLRALSELGGTALAAHEAELRRLRAGIPRFPEEINERGMFLESGMKSAVSFRKGCYVGQEVIEKVEALGRPPRLLYKLTLEGPIDDTGAPIESESGERLGSVVSSAFDRNSGKTYALALIKNRGDERELPVKMRGSRGTISGPCSF